MSAMSDAVKNGPRMTGAKTTHIEARIRLADAKAKRASDQASALRKRAKGDGPLARSRKLRAAVLQSAADRHRTEVNRLQTDLAKAKAGEAARNVKHVKRTVASTAAAGLVPIQPARPNQPGQAKPGQAKPGQARRPGRAKAGQAKTTAQSTPGAGMPTDETIASYDAHMRAQREHYARMSTQTAAPTKGTPAMTVSGEAVNIEQTRANLDQLKGQVADLRGSFEGISGSLASGRLNQLAGSLASADDSLDSVLTQITAAEKHLSDQEAIAEAAQAAGEMHTDTSFYGA